MRFGLISKLSWCRGQTLQERFSRLSWLWKWQLKISSFRRCGVGWVCSVPDRTDDCTRLNWFFFLIFLTLKKLWDCRTCHRLEWNPLFTKRSLRIWLLITWTQESMLESMKKESGMDYCVWGSKNKTNCKKIPWVVPLNWPCFEYVCRLNNICLTLPTCSRSKLSRRCLLGLFFVECMRTCFFRYAIHSVSSHSRALKLEFKQVFSYRPTWYERS